MPSRGTHQHEHMTQETEQGCWALAHRAVVSPADEALCAFVVRVAVAIAQLEAAGLLAAIISTLALVLQTGVGGRPNAAGRVAAVVGGVPPVNNVQASSVISSGRAHSLTPSSGSSPPGAPWRVARHPIPVHRGVAEDLAVVCATEQRAGAVGVLVAVAVALAEIARAPVVATVAEDVVAGRGRGNLGEEQQDERAGHADRRSIE